MKKYIPLILLSLSACSAANSQNLPTENTSKNTNVKTAEVVFAEVVFAEAVFAGGCFWCVEADFEKLEGVVEAVSGYGGGHTKNPTYKQVGRGGTGHYEVAKIIYDPSKISYSELVEYFWIHVDPTDAGGQFCDRGQTYQTAIFADENQIEIAKASKQALQKSGRLKNPVVTPILQSAPFYTAETYHQDYYKKNPVRYKFYRNGCRRDARIKQVWANN